MWPCVLFASRGESKGAGVASSPPFPDSWVSPGVLVSFSKQEGDVEWSRWTQVRMVVFFPLSPCP